MIYHANPLAQTALANVEVASTAAGVDNENYRWRQRRTRSNNFLGVAADPDNLETKGI